MRQRKQYRDQQKKRCNAEHCLEEENKCERHGAAAAHPMPVAIRGVKDGEGYENVCHHAMGKLHGEVVIEEIEPRRMKQQQMLTRRNERTVNQWPGVVDKTGFKPGDEPTERNLSKQENEYRCGARTKPPRSSPHSTGGSRRREQACRPDNGSQNEARHEEMDGQTFLRNI